MDEISAQIGSVNEGAEKYDEALKQLLSNRQFLARIAKRFVVELKNCSVEDIQNRYIAPEPPSVSKIGVARNTTNMVESIGVEDKSNNEANITYDIMFKVYYPGNNGKYIGMYINVEIQGDHYPGYPLDMRAVYYAARRLSSELTKIDRKTHYGGLQKVYSIWICMGDVPNSKAGTAYLLDLQKTDIIGLTDVPRDVYDLLAVVMVKINDTMKSDDATLTLLQTICSKLLSKEKKVDLLRNLGIQINQDIEGGVDRVCNLGESIMRTSENKGSDKHLIEQTCKKYVKGMDVSSIADALEEDETRIEQIIQAAKLFAPDYDTEKIYAAMQTEVQ